MVRPMKLSRGLVWFNVAAVLLVVLLEVARALDLKPGVAKNYRLRLENKTAHTFNDQYEDEEESLRVEETLMRTSNHPKIVRWRKELDRLQGRTPLEQVDGVNRLVNDLVTYRSDFQHWHRQDKWGFPFATLDEGGDCEDYAMLKRVSLHYLGWAEEGLYLVLGFSNLGPKPETHAVLMATLPDGSQLILDSLEKRVLPPAADHHFTPMVAIERDHLYFVGAGPAS